MIKDLQAHYRDLLRKHGDSPQAAQYSSRETQERRFEKLVDVADLNGCSILDFGCGTGQLQDYLLRHDVNVRYHGVDIVDEFLTLCQEKFPQGRFGQLQDFQGQQFDYVLVAGVFNNLMEDNTAFYQSSLKTLFSMASKGLSFNMMSAYVDYQDEGLFYEYPEKVFAFLKREVTPFVALHNDYEVKAGLPPFDFTVYAYRSGQ
jgi:cyclopropane fatty-acyl-phospholipid synthase-like methyltransferase